MAHNQVALTCPRGEWTQLTNADVTTISFMVLSGIVQIRYTAGTTPPTDEDQGWVYQSLNAPGEQMKALTALTPLSGANRVWARPNGGSQAVVLVDHA
jgi:hypothetical protein